MPPALDLELIKAFLTVVESKGFKAAAEQLHKTPAAISQQIKRLEGILGHRVLERSNQGISLTSAMDSRVTIMPLSASISSISRWLRLNR